jgi:imidazole glycerol-phosphate synthase subunit HisH
MSAREVAILDLGVGNLHSVARAFERAGARAVITRDPDEVRRADRLVVPGQGAIHGCAIALAGGLGEVVLEQIRGGRPYLGICLGMQVLFEESDEAIGTPCLAHFRGRVVRFRDGMTDAEGRRLKIPHMGWNQIAATHPVFQDGEYFYFVHSFYCAPDDPAIVAATADFGGPFCAAIAHENVLACQFHPEKSHRAGARVISRFLEVL